MVHTHIVFPKQLQILISDTYTKLRNSNFPHSEPNIYSHARSTHTIPIYLLPPLNPYLVTPHLISRDNEIVKETLRQICIRNNYDSHMLINYLWKMKMNISADIEKDKWNPANLEIYSWNTVGALKLNKDILKNCFNNSFRSIDKNGTFRHPIYTNPVLTKPPIYLNFKHLLYYLTLLKSLLPTPLLHPIL